jgi:class 3 adenylate cyclase
MKIKDFIFLFFILHSCGVWAQTDRLLLSDSVQYYELSGKIKHLKITDKNIDISEIQNIIRPEDWENTKAGRLNIPLFSEAEWYKITLVSETAKDWYLNIDNPLADSIFLFEISEGAVREWKGGYRFALVSKPINSLDYFIPLHLLPGVESTIYIRIIAKDLIRLPMFICTLPEKAEIQSTKNFWYGLFFGWVGIMLIYNFFVFYSTKEKAYLYYCLYNLGIGLLIATLEGFSYHYLWPDNEYIQEVSPAILSALTGVFSQLFMRYFLSTKNYVPVLNHIVSFIIIWDLVSIVLVFTGVTSIANFAVQISAITGSVLVIIVSIIVLRMGYRPALFFTQGHLFAMVGTIIYILGNFGILPTNNWVIAAIPVSTCVEVALLSLALADRLKFSKLQLEKARLLSQREKETANRELEQTVKERTYQISRQNQILGIQRKALEQKKQEIETERLKSDKLLLNILPKDVATELKESGVTKARVFSDVSVLFTDIVGFTQISEKVAPQKLVQELDYYFRQFDSIIEKHGLEKIKTIGDAYLAVAGFKENSENHAASAISAALELVDFVENLVHNKSEHAFRIRAGIHSGPLIAGVVGMHKFAFDIWGDTVNTAARMEQSSKPGLVNISGSTFQKAGEYFTYEYRGKIEAKNKGELDMYFVSQKIQSH